nr:hypothetical protein BgiMline_027540 [Biomphalaria glabrata]
MASACCIVGIVIASLNVCVSSAELPHKIPKYTTIGICDEKCPRFPKLVCKLDCLYVSADRKSGTDCINHFYDESGNIFHGCWL